MKLSKSSSRILGPDPRGLVRRRVEHEIGGEEHEKVKVVALRPVALACDLARQPR